METFPGIGIERRERAGYFEVSGAHLYTVLHEVPDPLARVLLVGPFASERHNSYLPWVRWARHLADHGIETLRYDHRGVGESTGSFEQMSFDQWEEDVALLAAWFGNQPSSVPLILHGLEVGALLAANAFHRGIGDGLLLWSPPADARQALRSTLLRWVGLERLLRPSEDVRPSSESIRQLEEGSCVEVEGYRWSSRMWRDSATVTLPDLMANDDQATSAYGRPVRNVKLDKQAAPLIKGGFVGYDEAKDFGWLFAPEAAWIAGIPRHSQESRP